MPVRGSISIKFFHIQPLQEDTMRREQMRKAGGLYPPIAEPNRSGFMPVSGGHEIYWEECGNPDGQPILFLHGGPGGGITKEDRQWFDPQKWRIILFDQRGCGQSTPLCELKENTTWDLVEDIWQLLKMLEIKKVTLYGCSWGSTLALVYAIKHPSTVKAIAIQGVYLGTTWEDIFYRHGAAGHFYPEVWERFAAQVPEECRNDPFPYYLQKLQHGTEDEKQHYAYEWNRCDFSLVTAEQPDETEMDDDIHSFKFMAMALLEAYYFVNGCFLEENFILNNVARLPRVPMIIVQGRFDCQCPPKAAYLLARAWQKLDRILDYRPVEKEGHDGEEISRQLDLGLDALHPRF